MLKKKNHIKVLFHSKIVFIPRVELSGKGFDTEKKSPIVDFKRLPIKSLEIKLKTLSAEHRSVATSYNNIFTIIFKH